MEAKFAKSDFKGNSGKFLIMFCDLTRYMISILFYSYLPFLYKQYVK